MKSDLNYFAKASVIQAVARLDDPPESALLELKRLLKTPQYSRAFFQELRHPSWLLRLERMGVLTDLELPSHVAGGLEVYFYRIARGAPKHLEFLAVRWPRLSPIAQRAAVIGIARSERPPRKALLLHLAQWLCAHPPADGSYLAHSMLQAAARVNDRKTFTCILRALIESHLVVASSDSDDRSQPGREATLYSTDQAFELALQTYRDVPTTILPFTERAFRRYLRLTDKARSFDHPARRSAVEDTSQDLGRSFGNSLFKLLRGLLAQWVSADPTSAKEKVDRLSRSRGLMARLGVYLVAEGAVHYPDLAARVLLQRANLDSSEMHHEMFVLLRKGAPFLSAGHKAQLLKLIRQGPPNAAARTRRWSEWTGEQFSAAAVTDLRERWILARLWMLRDCGLGVDGDIAMLSARHGEPEHAEFRSYGSAGAWGDFSPVSSEDASRWSPIQLLHFAAGWTPPRGGMNTPSQQGLAASIRTYAQRATPNDMLLAIAEYGRTLEPLYLSSALWGTADAIRNVSSSSAETPWTGLEAWLGLLSDPPSEDDSVGQDRWDDVFRGTLHVLERALSAGAFQNTGTQLRRLTNELVERLVRSPAHQKSGIGRGEPGVDPELLVSEAINTTGSRALELGIRVAVDTAPKEGDRQIEGWLRDLVEDVLAAGPRTSRTVLGMFLPHLFWLDRDWTVTHLSQLLPLDDDTFWWTWGGYLYANSKSGPLYKNLRRHYQHVMERVAEGSQDLSKPDQWLERTAQDLLSAFMGGVDDPKDGSPLILDLLAAAPAKVRERVGWLLFRLVSDSKQPQDTWNRLAWLLRARLDHARASGYSREYDTEMSWAAATLSEAGRVIPFDAIRPLLAETIASTARDADHLAWDSVIKYLGTQATDQPGPTLSLFRQMVEKTTAHVYVNANEVAAILRAGLRFGGQPALDARFIAGRFGELGNMEFRDLYDQAIRPDAQRSLGASLTRENRSDDA